MRYAGEGNAQGKAGVHWDARTLARSRYLCATYTNALAKPRRGMGSVKGMSGDLVSLRILLLCGSMSDRDRMRQGAATAVVPVDMLETEGVGAARAKLAAQDVDVVFVDAGFPAADRDRLIADARSARARPFVFVLAASKAEMQ